MAFCIRRSWSTKNIWGKGEKGEGGKGKSFPVTLYPFPVSVPCSPFTLFPFFPYSPFSPIPLVFLDVVSVNPRAVFLLVASLKENIFAVLASHQVHACVNVLI